MFFFAAIASLMMTVPFSEAGRHRQIVPVGLRFSGPDGPVFTVPGPPVPVASVEDGVTNKILGGFETAKDEFPFTVRLQNDDGEYCGGVLVHPRYVLTSAICAKSDVLTTVVLGDYELGTEDGTEQEIAIDSVIYHPLVGDVNGTALIKLASRANTRSDAVAVAQLVDTAAFMEKVLNNERNCMQLGWGYYQVDGIWKVPRKMRAINVNFVSDDELFRRGYGYMPERGLIGTEAEYTDECELGSACFGDEGSPVVCKKGGNWVVATLYSYSDRTDGCMTGVKGSENVYEYYDWIQTYIAA